MDVQELKTYLIDNDLVPQILESLGCHHIKRHEDYYSCCNPDGDRISAVNVFTSSLAVVNYTRDLDTISKYHDIFTLIQFYNQCNFFGAIKYVCDLFGLSTYHDFNEDMPESIVLTRMMMSIIEDGESTEVDRPLKPISEHILSYYSKCVNDQFLKDNISYRIQDFFELGYDQYSNRITIPIRNYDGALLGIKGRWFGDVPDGLDIQKYIYVEPCSKGKVLYGLDKSYNKIEETRFAYVGESEKFVMQLWEYGYENCVSTGGKTITRYQIDLLSRLCDKVVLCFDKDVEREELQNIADKFLGYIEVWAVIDDGSLLNDHESPSDDPEKWKKLTKQVVRLK